jgi:O-antigen/teichoic acid export membrane protein
VKRSDLLLYPIFFLLALLYLWPVTVGGLTLIPADNLFAFPPWSAFAAQFGATIPHNELLSDLLLENYPWKRLIVESLRQGQAPLWNPYLFTGVPFLAAGQHSALYPFSLLFYVFPIERVYGWFVALQLGIAGSAAYAFARTLRIGRAGALVAALTYEFSGFFLVSTVFPMVISAACWLPLLLLCEERIISALSGGPPGADSAVDNRPPAGWVVLGALVLGISLLAGHIEIAYYNLIVMAFYGAWRLGVLARVRAAGCRRMLGANAGALALMVTLGLGLAAVQIAPLYELVSRSFRQGSQSYETIIGYAFPIRQILTFFIPDFFGNPSHHGYFDLQSWRYVPVTQAADGQPINTIFWGVKNYVEAGSYLGILPLLLAAIAVAAALRRRPPEPGGAHARDALLFTALASVSLLFVFGTPLYALLFFGLPGFSQLHSPFRWVYPYTLSVALLAGMGMERLREYRQSDARRGLSHWWTRVPLAAGTVLLTLIALSVFMPQPFVAFAERVLRGSDLARRAFPDAHAFYSYEAVNLAKFAFFLAGAGLVLQIARRSTHFARWWQPLAGFMVATDLLVAGAGFYPAADPALLSFVPPAVQFLQQDKSLYRIATFNAAGEKTFNANVGMFYGLQDIRGYDSIIPKQYADWMNLIEGQGELIYNRIAPFYWYGTLDSALLNLANVKYILTTQPLPQARFALVYAGEINIYRNPDVLPRAFTVSRARELTDPVQLKSLDPRVEVLLEGAQLPAATAECAVQPTTVSYPTVNDVLVQADANCDTWLVLADAYADGWQAFDALGDAPEREVSIYRADGNFRAVQLSPGSHLVRFRYSPLSFRLGLYFSFFAAGALLLLTGYWAWGRRKRVLSHDRAASRVLKNSVLPMATSFLNKAIDTVFAAFMLRVLGPENAGKFAFAIIFIGYCDIVVNFGLSTLVMRDVSQDRSKGNRYLSNTALMRLLLTGVLVPVVALYLWARALPADTTLAIILLFVGLVPSSISASLSAIFYATEQMEYPAAITVVTTLVKVTISTVVLLAGYGFVGLAAANILVNLATMVILLLLFARKLFVPRLEFDARFGRAMISSSYPLMFNDMLSRLFNRVDTLILQPFKGDMVVGWYSTAYKYLEGINILPSTFTIALFPILSRYAADAPDALLRAYVKSMKYLVIIAMPLMVFSFVYADFIILVFGGEKYLPESAIALRLIIGFLPLSFINNVTHYVLIAVNQQKFLTRAFVLGAMFNIGANLLFIPAFSYRASAVITIFSELVLLIPFYIGIRNHVGTVNWFDLLWRPVAATGVMALVIWGLDSALAGNLGALSFALIIPAALLAYLAALVLTHTFNRDDREMLDLLLPSRFRRAL